MACTTSPTAPTTPWHQVVQRYALAGLDEASPWSRDFAPHFELPNETLRRVQHAFHELLNNAIDHSGGTQVTVSLRQTCSQLQLLISDDGCGLFERIAQTFAIDNAPQAMLELSKGKLTSRPDAHTGQGLFFTSRLADAFDLHANRTAFRFCADGIAIDDRAERGWHTQQRTLRHGGTTVYAAFALDTPRTLASVRQAHSVSGESMDFERTVVPLRLIASERVGLESRAQARSVATRFADFARVEIDFDGVLDVGQAFADELFRVLPRNWPAVTLVPRNMSSEVALMVGSVRASAEFSARPLGAKAPRAKKARAKAPAANARARAPLDGAASAARPAARS